MSSTKFVVIRNASDISIQCAIRYKDISVTREAFESSQAREVETNDKKSGKAGISFMEIGVKAKGSKENYNKTSESNADSGFKEYNVSGDVESSFVTIAPGIKQEFTVKGDTWKIYLKTLEAYPRELYQWWETGRTQLVFDGDQLVNDDGTIQNKNIKKNNNNNDQVQTQSSLSGGKSPVEIIVKNESIGQQEGEQPQQIIQQMQPIQIQMVPQNQMQMPQQYVQQQQQQQATQLQMMPQTQTQTQIQVQQIQTTDALANAAQVPQQSSNSRKCLIISGAICVLLIIIIIAITASSGSSDDYYYS